MSSKMRPSAMMAMAEQMKQPPTGLSSRSVPAVRPMPNYIPRVWNMSRDSVIRPKAKNPVIMAPAGRLASRRALPRRHSDTPQSDPKTRVVASSFVLSMVLVHLYLYNIFDAEGFGEV